MDIAAHTNTNALCLQPWGHLWPQLMEKDLEVDPDGRVGVGRYSGEDFVFDLGSEILFLDGRSRPSHVVHHFPVTVPTMLICSLYLLE